VVITFRQQDQSGKQFNVDWSYTFHHGLVHIGSSSSTGLLTNQTLWSFITENDLEYPSPVIVDGVAYFGSNDGGVYAVNVVTGAKYGVTLLVVW
jgi:outer membrane protein assembly factor BamB